MPAEHRHVTIAAEMAAPHFTPVTAAADNAPMLAGYGAVDLRGWCWMMAAMLFGVERALSRSAQRRRINA